MLELTRRCTLSCVHCRVPAGAKEYKDELSFNEWLKVLDNISSFSRPTIILSGGEALLRKDVFDIISYGNKKGLCVVLATCGVVLTDEKTKKLKDSGIKRVSVSIDGMDATTHDFIRREKGVFDKAISAIKTLKTHGIEFQINTTVTRNNLDQLEDIIKLAKEHGAVSFHPFFLVPTGRARHLKDQEISPQQYEKTLNFLYKLSKDSSISIKPTCAPHYFRQAQTGGCLGGKSFAFISSSGKVQICGFLEVECGDIRERDFSDIWRESAVFNHLRDYAKYKGKCAECEYLQTCGGCRARAYEATGDYMQEEPECVYQPMTVKS